CQKRLPVRPSRCFSCCSCSPISDLLLSRNSALAVSTSSRKDIRTCSGIWQAKPPAPPHLPSLLEVPTRHTFSPKRTNSRHRHSCLCGAGSRLKVPTASRFNSSQNRISLNDHFTDLEVFTEYPT